MTEPSRAVRFPRRSPAPAARLVAIAALAGCACAAPLPAADAPPWLLRSGSLAVSERSLVMGLAVKNKVYSADEARSRADQQLARLRERLVLAAAAVRAGLDGSPAVTAALEVFRSNHLVDLFLEEKVVRPAKEASRPAGADLAVRGKLYSEERMRRYARLVSEAAAEYPAAIEEQALAAVLPGGEGDPVVARLLGKEIRAAELRQDRARVGHPSKDRESELQVVRTVLESRLAKIRFAALAEREGFAARADFVDDFADRRLRVLAGAYTETAVYPGAKLAAGQAEAWYEANRERLRRGEEREIFEILVAEKAEADAVAARLAAGGDFAEEVRARSLGPTRDQGGRIGFVAPGDILPELEKVALNLRAGETSAPVRSPHGWHLLRCAQVVSGRVPPLEEVRPRIEQQLLEELRAKALADELARIAPAFPVEFNQKRYEEYLKSL